MFYLLPTYRCFIIWNSDKHLFLCAFSTKWLIRRLFIMWKSDCGKIIVQEITRDHPLLVPPSGWTNSTVFTKKRFLCKGSLTRFSKLHPNWVYETLLQFCEWAKMKSKPIVDWRMTQWEGHLLDELSRSFPLMLVYPNYSITNWECSEMNIIKYTSFSQHLSCVRGLPVVCPTYSYKYFSSVKGDGWDFSL